MTGSPPVDTGALLRVAGLPVDVWLAAGSPNLFTELARTDQDGRLLEQRCARMAEAIGDLLVPHPRLSGPDRAATLRSRRALHRGAVVPGPVERTAALADVLLPDHPLATELRSAVSDAERLTAAVRHADLRLAEEEQRLLGLPWRLLHDVPAGRRALLDGDIAVHEDIAERTSAGEPWTTKRMRQRGEYLWRMVTRGATRATPRGWLAHVAALPVTTDGWQGDDLTVSSDLAAVYTGTIDQHHADPLAVLDQPDAVVGLAPLTWLEPGHLRSLMVTGEHRAGLGAVGLRRGPVLDRVYAAFADGPRNVNRLVEELGVDTGLPRSTVDGLLRHLARTGVVQVSAPPEVVHVRQDALAHPAPITGARDDRYIDVYRRTAAGLDRGYAERLRWLAATAMRVAATSDADGPADPPEVPPGIGPRPRPLLEIVAEYTRSDHRVRLGTAHHHDWPVPRDPASPYGRLHRWLDQRLDTAGPDGIALDDRVLDNLDAPRPVRSWPVDALLRPVRRHGGPLAVLGEVTPAGLFDARFLSALSTLDEPTPHVDAYRAFLDSYSAATGGRFVELLVPPQSRRAANAVRRVRYTDRWTADPDSRLYFPPEADLGDYLPLAEITLRTVGSQVLAEAGGELVWPVSHTVRTVRPPWGNVLALLRTASPQPPPNAWRKLTYSLAGWPDRDHMPRITIGGELVLAPAQWRLGRDRLLTERDPARDRALRLVRLRAELGLPRFVNATANVHTDPIAIDLMSLRTPRLLDRLLTRADTELLLTELLPAPEHLPVVDAVNGRRAVAELLLRSPADTNRWSPPVSELPGRTAGETWHQSGAAPVSS